MKLQVIFFYFMEMLYFYLNAEIIVIVNLGFLFL